MILRCGIAVWAAGALAFAGSFTFTIGSPVASQDFQMKMAAFVFRTEGCAEPAKAQVGATAEGLVKGARQSVALRVAPSASRPGVFAIPQSWPRDGAWVVNLTGTCDGASAGAIVPFGSKGFIRESSKFLARPATSAEINAALQSLAQGEKQ
jgi:hypothetical protein